MKRWYWLAAVSGIIFQGCGFFAEPETFGRLQINIRFAGDHAATRSRSSSAFAKAGITFAPQAVDRVIVIVREYSDKQTPNRLLDREIVREEFRLGNDRQLQAVIDVPLQNAGINYFILEIKALQGLEALYFGQEFISFDEKNRRVTANIQLDPVAFRVLTPAIIPPTPNRLSALSGQAQDTTLTDFEIVADSVSVKFPARNLSVFSNAVMLFGDNTLARVIAYRGKENIGEASRQITYTGAKSDILIALAWDQPVDLDLAITNPLQEIISAGNLGDDINGRLLQSDEDGYGPEVFEWRANSALQRGLFVARVARSRTDLGQSRSGRAYIFLGERQNLPVRRILRFSFGPQDLQLLIDNILIQ